MLIVEEATACESEGMEGGGVLLRIALSILYGNPDAICRGGH